MNDRPARRPVPDGSLDASGEALHWRTGQLMRIVLRRTSLQTGKMLGEAGYGDLRPMHLLVIEGLFLSAVRATDLAETIGLTKQATGQIIDRMEALGYVERVPDPADGRAKLVQLTDRGQRAARALRSIADDTDARWREILGQNRYGQLRAALGSLITASRR
jgi:DNA-binding MarR family transcriptional regulator